jgi:hypothetical protein
MREREGGAGQLGGPALLFCLLGVYTIHYSNTEFRSKVPSVCADG